MTHGVLCAGCDQIIEPGQPVVGSDVFAVYAHAACANAARKRFFSGRPVPSASAAVWECVTHPHRTLRQHEACPDCGKQMLLD